jgi:hypothetical protein
LDKTCLTSWQQEQKEIRRNFMTKKRTKFRLTPEEKELWKSQHRKKQIDNPSFR